MYGLDLYIGAFKELSTCRAGGGLNPIPFTAIMEYADRFEIEDFNEFLYVMRKMDDALIKYQADKNKPKEGADVNKAGKGSPGSNVNRRRGGLGGTN